jgi:AcrR family transcriptional regulator
MGRSLSKTAAAKSGAVRFTRQALYELIWNEPLSSVATKLGISGNGLAKICDRVAIPYPKRGHWNGTVTRAQERTPLPLAPLAVGDSVIISSTRAGSRRTRTRLSREVRADQLLDAAAAMIRMEGLQGVTLKRVAQAVGISEAQAYNYYKNQIELLVALTRRETNASNAPRLAEIARVPNFVTFVALNTVMFLREVSQRGTLMHTLYAHPIVRRTLRLERTETRNAQRGQMALRMQRDLGVASDLAHGAAAVARMINKRAGDMVTEQKIPLELAERLVLSIVPSACMDLSEKLASDD